MLTDAQYTKIKARYTNSQLSTTDSMYMPAQEVVEMHADCVLLLAAVDWYRPQPKAKQTLIKILGRAAVIGLLVYLLAALALQPG